MVGAWASLLMFGFALIYWGMRLGTWVHCVRLSGSSLLTLGIADIAADGPIVPGFMEAILGMIITALVVNELALDHAERFEHEYEERYDYRDPEYDEGRVRLEQALA